MGDYQDADEVLNKYIADFGELDGRAIGKLPIRYLSSASNGECSYISFVARKSESMH